MKAEKKAVLEILDTEGNVLETMEQASGNGIATFELDGNTAGVFYHLTLD